MSAQTRSMLRARVLPVNSGEQRSDRRSMGFCLKDGVCG